MSIRRQRLGRRGEDLAVRHLEASGYRILERNYRTRIGEIDIIAREGETLVFVEVKSRRSDRFGGPKGAVDFRKRMKLSQVALWYLKGTGRVDQSARFDVVTVGPEAPGGARVEVTRNAFELAYG